MASTGVNVGPPVRSSPIVQPSMVLRWSALAVGVFYGFSHQRTINATQRAQHEKHEWESKQKLIDQAKAEYAKKYAPAASAASKDDAITDVNSPKFDLEQLLLKAAKESS
ncbi:F1F0 ATP synthase subunit e, mitochondrial [Conoideocrella luteorostrata]|uniref:ATP synthase F(0) complex subunit e, mitochondrial n=1 Tax=Conoideocrella luteorostrata TaxID=1105319 RepID=A0AAJ0CF04_9HYPO|nr:F1F0 ATP synthase subunit e, mitochondrial [Conoideocrella luteorostrata]